LIPQKIKANGTNSNQKNLSDDGTVLGSKQKSFTNNQTKLNKEAGYLNAPLKLKIH